MNELHLRLFISVRCRRRRPGLGEDWGRVKSVSKVSKRLLKRKAADSKSRLYVSAQYQTDAFDKQLFYGRAMFYSSPNIFAM